MQQRDQPVYIITERTQALYKSESSYYKTEILENVKRKKSRLSSLEIIDYSCIVQGSSTLKGRIESVINTFQIHNKVPIMINPVKGIYLFPTASIRSPIVFGFRIITYIPIIKMARSAILNLQMEKVCMLLPQKTRLRCNVCEQALLSHR
ncbi:competence protein ComK [Virgibacillus soli]|uniref:Competence protein ComK n=1 Tax=Paracerasibacillus soli TaxID=480284 RepID=A0ABU5CVN4_9BACI|nr:competence protein ComK [Virgibacillus soli]MDY0409463.1 competence protein ComK [Virgibacillus soli]